MQRCQSEHGKRQFQSHGRPEVQDRVLLGDADFHYQRDLRVLQEETKR